MGLKLDAELVQVPKTVIFRNLRHQRRVQGSGEEAVVMVMSGEDTSTPTEESMKRSILDTFQRSPSSCSASSHVPCF